MLPIFRTQPGFVRYGLALLDDGSVASVSVWETRDEAEAVLKIASTEAGSKSETLHEKCAAQWFAALRDFENGPSDDDNSWQEQA